MPNQAYRIAMNDIEIIAEGGVRGPVRAYTLNVEGLTLAAGKPFQRPTKPPYPESHK